MKPNGANMGRCRCVVIDGIGAVILPEPAPVESLDQRSAREAADEACAARLFELAHSAYGTNDKPEPGIFTRAARWLGFA